jgi:hypothetical protein
MTLRHTRHTFAFSRRDASEVCKNSAALKNEGVGNAGRPMRPQPRARKWWLECARVFTAEAPESPGIPAREWFTAYSALSPGDRLSCHRRWRKLRQLDARTEASGPHDFAVRFSVVRQRHLHVHRIPSRVRGDRDTPLEWDETRSIIDLILISEKQNIFANRAGQENRTGACRANQLGPAQKLAFWSSRTELTRGQTGLKKQNGRRL